jgi:hypothetical protein
MKEKYSDQIFINCPFDDKYKEIFDSIVFTILDCGFVPRCSKEVYDSSRFRLNSIVEIIRKCKYGIHDISRVELEHNNLPRFNMPFELGIFYGAKIFGANNQKSKNCIILEKEKYRYQEFISDISGVDITAHNNEVEKCIISIRNWLKTCSKRISIPDGALIIERYKKFLEDFKNVCSKRNTNQKNMPFIDFTQNISDWLNMNSVNVEPLFSAFADNSSPSRRS